MKHPELNHVDVRAAQAGGSKVRYRFLGVLVVALAIAKASYADDLRVMTTGLGDGTITGAGITCGFSGSDCDESGIAAGSSVLLSVSVQPGSVFRRWGAACASVSVTPPATPDCRVSVNALTSVRAHFDLASPITQLSDFTPGGIRTYLATNLDVDTPAEFVAALPQDFKENWILMPRSESLQSGTAALPRILLVSADATRVFTFGLENFPASSTIQSPPSFPGSHMNAIEYMQWDATEKNFRFHEIVLATVPDLGDDIDPGPAVVPRFPSRPRQVKEDDVKCFACHSTRNVMHPAERPGGPSGGTPGTTGITPGTVKFKSKPNWDTYDSWGGMLPFNRDRIYKGSVEAAAFRGIFNLWTWRDDEVVREVIEQLKLQPDGVPDGTPAGTRDHRIARLERSDDKDSYIQFGFDPNPQTFALEPRPTGAGPSVNYSFDRRAGSPTGGATNVARNNEFVTLHHSCQPTSDEGRGVEFFDLLTSGLGSVSPAIAMTPSCPRPASPPIDQVPPNAQRIVDELISHRFATGSVPIDVRPIALAIAEECLSVSGAPDITSTQTVTGLSPASALTFFEDRNGLTFDQVYDDTRRRGQYLTRRKADIEKKTLDRTGDIYVYDPDPYDGMPPTGPYEVQGLIAVHGGGTLGVTGGTGGLDTSMRRLRQEVFRRPPTPGHPDETVMGRIYADREDDSTDPPRRDNTAPVALYRFFLEPLGVSVDKWSMGVRGRSRTYTFADLLGSYTGAFKSELKASLGLSDTASCAQITPLATTQFGRLPGSGDTPTYTDIQRIFNKSCIECHGGLGYPPYHSYDSTLDLSENETSAAGERRLWRSMVHARSIIGMPACPPGTTTCPVGTGTDVANSYLYQRITDNGLLAHPYNPAEPYNTSNPDDPSDPDVADERCPAGLMPCEGPPLSKTDIETFRRWIIGGRPNTEGDPHITTVDGLRYDFQSAGEFVLLRDEDMELQARQTPVTTAGPLGPNRHTGLTSCVSVNTAVAMRVGLHRVTYQPEIRLDPIDGQDGERSPNDEGARRLVLRIDGKPVKLGAEIPLAGGGRITSTSESDAIEVHYPGGTSVVVTPGWWSRHQIWWMNIGVRHARAVMGVMGAVAPGNWLPARADGSFLGPMPSDPQERYDALYGDFGASWQVKDTTSLFDYEPGLSPSSFVDESWPFNSPTSCSAPSQPGGPVPAPEPPPISEAEAARLCGAITDEGRRENCVLDVVATREPTFAATYEATERLELRLMPKMPVLVSPADNSLQSPADVDFVWTGVPRAEDPTVKYRHCLWNSDQLFDFNNCIQLSADDPTVFERLAIGSTVWILLVLLVALLLWLVFFAKMPRKWLYALLTLLLILVVCWLAYAVRQPRVLEKSAVDLEANRTYYWKVVAENADGVVIESPTWRFEVE